MRRVKWPIHSPDCHTPPSLDRESLKPVRWTTHSGWTSQWRCWGGIWPSHRPTQGCRQRFLGRKKFCDSSSRCHSDICFPVKYVWPTDNTSVMCCLLWGQRSSRNIAVISVSPPSLVSQMVNPSGSDTEFRVSTNQSVMSTFQFQGW